jgi:hypothetical protein
MSQEPRQSDQPIDRLTELCAEMTVPLERPENAKVRAIVFLDDMEEERGGLQMFGWEDHTEAMAHLFVHMKAVFQANGADLDFIGIPESPEGVEDVRE